MPGGPRYTRCTPRADARPHSRRGGPCRLGEWRIRLEYILEAISRIEEYTRGLDFEAFADDRLRSDAVMRNFQVIGEAARHVPADVQARHLDIPWKEMRDMRNLIIHAHFGVSLRIVWDTLRSDLPALREQLQRVLDQEPSDRGENGG